VGVNFFKCHSCGVIFSRVRCYNDHVLEAACPYCHTHSTSFIPRKELLEKEGL
jgi:hypothetical protein